MELWFAANQASRLGQLITVVTRVRPVFLKHYTLGLEITKNSKADQTLSFSVVYFRNNFILISKIKHTHTHIYIYIYVCVCVCV